MTPFIDRAVLTVPETAAGDSGFFNVPARIARTGIQIYYGQELVGVDGVEPDQAYRIYRAADEVFAPEALVSFKNLPVTDGHPPHGVSADNHTQTAIGVAIGEVERAGNFVVTTLSIRDADVIEKLARGEHHQISTGYFADVILRPGTTPSGEAYDGIQTQIRGNHIALVDAARCGPDCRIGDMTSVKDAPCHCASCQTIRGHIMSLSQNRLRAQEDPDPMAELKAENDRLKQKLDTAMAEIEQLKAALEAKSGEVEALEAVPSADQAFDARVRDRANLLQQARDLLGDLDFTAKSDSEIRRAAIAHIYGDGFVANASDHALSGMFKVILRERGRLADTLNGAVIPSSETTSLQAARAKRDARLTNAWKERHA